MLPDLVKSKDDNGASADQESGGPFDRARLAGTNVNPDSLLATDYLNHFNEVAMMIEMIPTMPDCLAEVWAWEPVEYTAHFINSGLRDAQVAVDAYAHVSDEVKTKFEAIIQALDARMEAAKSELQELVVMTEDIEHRTFKVTEIAQEIYALIDKASAVVNSGGTDALATDADGDRAAQSAVNILFD